MSCYILSANHINYLVNLAICTSGMGGFSYVYDGKRISVSYGGDAAEVAGQMLRDANVESVAACYPNESREFLPGDADEAEALWCFNFKKDPSSIWPRERVSPGFALKQIQCFEYQSCELPGWEQSEAFAFLSALRDRLARRVDGYQEAPWGID